MKEVVAVRKLVSLALEEDLPLGDITAELTVPTRCPSQAVIVAREPMVVCGLPIIEVILEQFGEPAQFELLQEEGALVKAETPLAKLRGEARTLLSVERTILNFLQRLSGVATHTRHFVQQAAGIRVLDTRKTTPGFRYLEKYAVRTGGGVNHRYSLSDMILVKNNHIDANGGDLPKTLKRLQRKKPAYMPVEVEVRNLKELKEALPFGPTIVMLDNFSDPEIVKALAVVAKVTAPPLVEISGGITAARLPKLKALGVQYISAGSLTTQARNVDISMRVVLGKGRA